MTRSVPIDHKIRPIDDKIRLIDDKIRLIDHKIRLIDDKIRPIDDSAPLTLNSGIANGWKYRVTALEYGAVCEFLSPHAA